MKRKTKKFWLSCLSFVMMLGIVASSILPAYADTATIGRSDVEIQYSTYFPGSNARTQRYTIDGEIAYCIEPLKPAPPNGDYETFTITSAENPLLIKIFCNGYGGINDITKQYFGDNDEYRYLCTHIALGYAYTGSHYGVTDAQFQSSGLYDFIQACAMSDYTGSAICCYGGPGTQIIAMYGFGETTPGGEYDIKLVKIDSETALAQGDAKLQGAVYGLYARADILDPTDDTGQTVLAPAGALLMQATTDASGVAYFDGLVPGSYYVKEISPSVGYMIDPTEYDVNVTANGTPDPVTGEIEVVVDNPVITSREQVKKQPFQIIKAGFDGENTDAVPLVSGFSAYLKSRLGVKADGTYDFENANPVVIAQDGSTVMYTDATGYAKSAPLPYGTYVIREVDVPDGYFECEPFEVIVTEHKPTEPQTWRIIINEEIEAKLKITKMDSTTGKSILLENIEFKIFDITNNQYVVQYTTYPTVTEHTTFKTDSEGYLILPQPLELGEYRIEEVSAPPNYILDTNYPTVVVGSSATFEKDETSGELYIPVEYQNTPAMGRVELTKTGPTLTAFENGKFVWEEKGLVGAEFEVYAVGDILTHDMQLDANGERTKYYSDGDLVGTIVTGADGKGVLEDLPLGNYKMIETVAPVGYILDDTPIEFSVEFVDDSTPIIEITQSILNDKQDVVVDVTKKITGTSYNLAGAKFELSAESDIVNYEGTVIVNAGDVIATGTSASNGKVNFGLDLPFGVDYKIVEISAPAGYTMSDEEFTFTATLPNNSTDESVTYSKVFYNDGPTPSTPDKPDTPKSTPVYGLLRISFDENTWNRNNWQTEDSGEEGYSVVLSVEDTEEENKGYATYIIIGVVSVVCVGGVILLYLRKKKQLKKATSVVVNIEDTMGKAVEAVEEAKNSDDTEKLKNAVKKLNEDLNNEEE
ncbi:MAG: hypothetical protein J6A75_03485 [Lachnospiraceae bacterium]|nr:hypothetical protein [Lachnospiraceae bacterium]